MTLEEKVVSSIGTGEDNAISLSELIKITGLQNRQVRKLIEHLRRKGTVICASSSGYYKPSNSIELKAYLLQERARARSITQTIAPAEKLLRTWRY